MIALEVRSGDRTLPVTVADDGTVTIENQAFTVVSIGGGRYRVRDGATCWTIAVAGP